MLRGAALLGLVGLTLAEADLFRRGMSGKMRSVEAMRRLVERFFASARERGLPEESAQELWRQIRSFAGYSFCKAHSASYAQISFQVVWLKAHYPAEFFAAVLTNQGGFYHPSAYVEEARRMGLRILLPDVNRSEWEYTVERVEPMTARPSKPAHGTFQSTRQLIVILNCCSPANHDQSSSLHFLRRHLRAARSIARLRYQERLAPDHKIVLMSFEKPDDWEQIDRRDALRKQMRAAGITWIPLRYHKRPSALATAFDIAQGVAVGAWTVMRHRIRIVHARSYVSSVIALALKKLFRLKYVFDMRGFWADERVEGGLWPAGGRLYRVPNGSSDASC